MGDLAQEMWDMAQHNFEACCRLDKRLGNNYSAYRYAEQRITELEAALSQSMGDHVDTGRALRLARAENQRLRDALEIISGKRQCVDNLMSNSEIANAALLGGGENG